MGGIQLRANPAQPSSTRSFSILRPAARKPVGCLPSFLCFAKKSPTGGPVGPTGRLETALPVGDWKSPLRASGMIPRETGRGWSISGAHRIAAVERLVGATLVVALPRTAPPSAGHCLGTPEPGGWSGDFPGADWDRRPEYPCCNGSGVILGAVLRPRIQKKPGGRIVSPSLSSSPPHGAKESERTDLPSKAKSQDVEPPSFEYTQRSKEGAKNDAPPNEHRLSTRRPGRASERRPSGRRLGPASGAASFRRRLGSASFRAPGMATWSGDSVGERCDPAGHPQGVPLRSPGIGSLKEEVTYNLRYENCNLTAG